MSQRHARHTIQARKEKAEESWVTRLITRTGTKEDYAKYLRSDHWKQKRVEAANAWTKILGGRLRCLLCDHVRTTWHHTPEGYSRLFAEDPVKHLRPLCPSCHDAHEKRKKRNRRT